MRSAGGEKIAVHGRRYCVSPKDLDVVGIENALVDIIIDADEHDLLQLGYQKGVMHLVEEEEQARLLQYLAGRDLGIEVGGAGPNIIRLVASLGARTCLAGMVADDDFGRHFRQRLAALGIMDRIATTTCARTGTSVILVTGDAERTMHTHLGACRHFAPSYIPHPEIARAHYFVITGYQWDTDNQIAAAGQALQAAKAAGAKVVFDVADPFCIARHRQAFLDLMTEAKIDILFANQEEAKALVGAEPEQAIAELASKVEVAIIKLGAAGALVQSGKTRHHVASRKVAVRDTTAAGDMFAGGFLYGLLQGFDLPRCGALAARCAEVVIQRIGATLPEDLRVQVGLDQG